MNSRIPIFPSYSGSKSKEAEAPQPYGERTESPYNQLWKKFERITSYPSPEDSINTIQEPQMRTGSIVRNPESFCSTEARPRSANDVLSLQVTKKSSSRNMSRVASPNDFETPVRHHSSGFFFGQKAKVLKFQTSKKYDDIPFSNLQLATELATDASLQEFEAPSYANSTNASSEILRTISTEQQTPIFDRDNAELKKLTKPASFYPNVLPEVPSSESADTDTLPQRIDLVSTHDTKTSTPPKDIDIAALEVFHVETESMSLLPQDQMNVMDIDYTSSNHGILEKNESKVELSSSSKLPSEEFNVELNLIQIEKEITEPLFIQQCEEENVNNSSIFEAETSTDQLEIENQNIPVPLSCITSVEEENVNNSPIFEAETSIDQIEIENQNILVPLSSTTVEEVRDESESIPITISYSKDDAIALQTTNLDELCSEKAESGNHNERTLDLRSPCKHAEFTSTDFSPTKSESESSKQNEMINQKAPDIVSHNHSNSTNADALTVTNDTSPQSLPWRTRIHSVPAPPLTCDIASPDPSSKDSVSIGVDVEMSHEDTTNPGGYANSPSVSSLSSIVASSPNIESSPPLFMQSWEDLSSYSKREIIVSSTDKRHSIKEREITLSNDLRRLVKQNPPLPASTIFLKKWNLIRKRKLAPCLHTEVKVQRTAYRKQPSILHTDKDIEMDAFIY